MDQVFEEEQAHLSATYQKLENIEAQAQAKLKSVIDEALKDRDSLMDDLSLDKSSDIHVETMVEYESLNRLMDMYNLSADVATETLHNAQMLLRQPYFAKISLQFKAGTKPKDIYIGASGMVDDNYRHFIVDWRSPVAEVYYNQENGLTSYEANGREISCELKLRRQFDIEKDKLNAYFDTSVAIQDQLLLNSLAKERSSHLTAITTTIQKEQNEVIRHDDVPVLLVNGIAGSGKTSVLLQRIAYLFYRERENLKHEDVFLITPNPVFTRYIEDVLPEMGEANPESVTWDELMGSLGIASRGIGRELSCETLRSIDEALPNFHVRQGEFNDLRINEEVVISAAQARGAYEKLKRFPTGTHRSSLTAEDLLDRLEQRIKRLAPTEKAQDLLMDLSEEEQLNAFGEYISPLTLDENELKQYTEKYLRYRYAPIAEQIEDGAWLNIDRIGMRMLGTETLSSVEWLYLKLAIAGGTCRNARYVIIDEVQDYTAAQLMTLARYFNNAHFLMLGDENQAIREGTASFDDIRDIFTTMRGGVAECSLMTSYRSSPEITALFTKLMSPDERVKADSVQREGTEPVIMTCANEEEANAELVRAVEEATASDCLAAVIAPNKQRMNQLAKVLEGSAVALTGKDAQLPDKGVVLLSVKLAKGLEFDQVIVTDADKGSYPDDLISRHRLYTAISRATQKVTLIAKQQLTTLLS